MRFLKSSVARLALALTLAFPLAISATAISVSAAWYYQPYTDYISGPGAYAGTTFTSTVEFTIGFNSSGYPITVDVSKYTDTLAFPKCGGYSCPITHYTTQGLGCNPWYEASGTCGSFPWSHRSTLSCTATAISGCSLTRIEQPRLWMNWYPASATASNWTNPGLNPVGPCTYYHLFNPPGMVGTTTANAHDIDHGCLTV